MKTRFSKATVLAAVLCSASVWAATPDGFLTAKTKLSLMTTAGVRSTAVHVDTNDGIVTLYGKVPTAQAKSAAEKATTEVGGVREVKNLLQVVPESTEKAVARADKEIKDEVERVLKGEARLKDSSINVKSVDKGVVLLSGKAATFGDHLLALTWVDRVPGVRRVASEIEAPTAFGNEERFVFLHGDQKDSDRKDLKTPPAGKGAGTTTTSLNDTRITSAVKLRLLTNAIIPSTEIKVDTDNGVVTLFGIVPTDVAKATAESEATKVSDVQRVHNELQVVPRNQKEVVAAGDKEISKELKTVFKNRPELKDVNTDVKNGAVRLTGAVDSGWDRLLAVRLARQCAGTKSVQEQLTIRDDKASRF
jgi:hyperosmotically inducible protein